MNPGMHSLRSSFELTALAVLLASTTAVGCDRFKKKTVEEDRAAVEAAKPQPKRSDFGAICEGKPGPDAGAPYVASSGKVAPAVFFLQTEGSGFDETAMDDVEAWKGTAWQAEKPDDAQLVICGIEKSQSKADGYCNYVDDSGKTSSIPEVAREMSIAIYEAKTGKKVDAYDLHVPAPTTCDHSRSTRAPSTNAREWSTVAAIVAAPHQPQDVPAPKLQIREMWAVCEGRPMPGAPAYQAAAGSRNKVTWFKSRDGKDFQDAIHYVDGIDRPDYVGNTDLPPLVGCYTLTRGKKTKECKFTGDKTLAVHEGSWAYKIVEARTGKTIGERTFAGRSSYCPFTWSFSDGDVEDGFDAYDARKAWVGAFANPTGAPPPAAAVAGGAPRPSAFFGGVSGGRPAGRPAARPSFGDSL